MLSTIIVQIHMELLLYVQLSLLRGILCVISADNKIYGGVQLHRQCKNLKKRVLIHVVSQIYAK